MSHQTSRGSKARIRHTNAPQVILETVPDVNGEQIQVGSGLFALNPIMGVQPKRALGREIDHGEVFQCFGVWKEAGNFFVAISERGWLQKRGVFSKLFRKIG